MGNSLQKFEEQSSYVSASVKKEIIIKCPLEEMIKSFFKDYVIVWHDPNVGSLGNQEYIAKLKRFCEVLTFTDWQNAKEYLQQAEISCHVITSGKNGELLAKEINSFKSVENIYVFCGDKGYHSTWANNYSKISCVEDQIEKILLKIQEKLLKWSQELSSFQLDFPAFIPLFNDHDKSRLNRLHLYLKVLPNFQNREQAKQDFLALSKGIFSGLNNQQHHLIRFENSYNEYNKEQTFQWYSKESFLNKVTNNCLRIATSDSIQYSRLLIQDLERAIKEEYHTKSKRIHGVVYRGTRLSEKEWSSLKENVGREIEMHGFLSVSKDRNIAEDFLSHYTSNRVFITILMPKGLNEEEQGFAEIEQYSVFPHEKEILFNIRSRFTVLDVDDNYPGKSSCHHLVLLYGAQSFRKFVTENNPFIEISIPKMENIVCVNCKIQAQDTADEIFFASLRISERHYYCCKKCIGEKSSENVAPLLCFDVANKEGETDTKKKKIKGFLLTNSDNSKIPFCGYHCCNCKKEKQKRYFTCMDCHNQRQKRWCEDCFDNTQSCTKAEHIILLETAPFSFWCESMSQDEENHLKFQSSFAQKGDDIFQQGEMYVKCHEYEKAMDFYNIYIKENGEKGNDADLATAFNNIGSVFKNQKEYMKALRYYLKSLDIRRFVSGNHHPDTAVSLSNIGSIYCQQGDYQKALDFYFEGLEIENFAYGGSHISVAVSSSNIAIVYSDQEEYNKALEYHLKALDIYKSVYGEKHAKVAESYFRIGLAYYSQQDYKMAIDNYSKALEIFKSINGEKHAKVAESYFQIASAYYSQQDYKMAIDNYSKALEIYKSINGEKHAGVAESYFLIASAYDSQQDYKMAIDNYSKALEIFKSVDGEMVAESYFLIASAYDSQQDYKMVIDNYSKALEIYKSINGEKHAKVAESYFRIGLAYDSQQDYKMAIDNYSKALEIFKSINGEKHAKVAESYFRIGLAYDSQQDYKMVIDNYSKALEIYKSVDGEKHAKVAGCYFLIANVYYSQQDYKMAIDNYSKALEIFKSINGEKHAYVAHSHFNMGLAYDSQQDYKMAVENYSEALEIYKSVNGDKHAKVAESYFRIGLAYDSQQDYKMAIDNYSKALEIFKSINGEKHAKVAESYFRIGLAYYSQQDYKMAIDNFSKALKIYKSINGEKHPDVALSYLSIGLAYEDQTEDRMALDYYTKALEIFKSVNKDDHPLIIHTSNKIQKLHSKSHNQQKRWFLF